MKIKKTEFKPYFRMKGKYGDGRKRCLIEWREDSWTIKSKAIPKPEILLRILDGINWTIRTRGKKSVFELSIRDTFLQKNKTKNLNKKES